jgi:hypothetical protein
MALKYHSGLGTHFLLVPLYWFRGCTHNTHTHTLRAFGFPGIDSFDECGFISSTGDDNYGMSWIMIHLYGVCSYAINSPANRPGLMINLNSLCAS